MSDPLAGFCRLLTPQAYDPVAGYTGEFMVTFPAMPSPPGDGQIYEWDWVIPIPDSTDFVGFELWAGPPAIPTTEWTFDSRDPTFWTDYGWYMERINAGSMSWWGSLTEAATWDGTWAGPFLLGFNILLDGASDPSWWEPPPRVTVLGQGRGGASRPAVAGSGVRWQHPKSDVGSGAATFSPEDAASVGYGDVLRFSVDGTTRFAALVEQRQAAVVSPNEESEQLVTLSGRGTVAAFEEAVVAPEGGAGPNKTQQTRVFNFANPQLLIDTSLGWVPNGTVSAPRAKPEGWPDPTTEWVWSQDPNTLPVPAGDVYFITDVYIDHDTTAEVWCAADDGYEVWWDGEKLFEDTLDAAWTGIAKHQEIFIRSSSAAPLHRLAIHARNNNALLAGLFACVVTKDGAGSITNSIARTTAGPGSGWWVLAYPAQPPGFTPGRVMKMLLSEAVSRGAQFTASNFYNPYNAFDPYPFVFENRDWAGTLWPVVSDISVQVGQDLLSVLHQLAETYLDFDMDYGPGWDGIGNLQLFVHKGAPTGVTLAAGTNLAELQADGRV